MTPADHPSGEALQPDAVLKAFDRPDRRIDFVKGYFEIVELGGLTLGRATYEPGWKWSVHVGRDLGQRYCTVEHVGMVVSGAAAAAFENGTVVELRAGELFHIPAVPHDSWVIGDESYVSIHLVGAEKYARG
jgi:hypothetical protein